jgi:hypothetical protein
LKIKRLSLEENHPDIANSYEILGTVCMKKQYYNKYRNRINILLFRRSKLKFK